MFACLKDTVITVYVVCPAVAQRSLPPSVPCTLSLFISVYVPLSWQRWHIEGTAFWAVNLMEPLTCGVAWINMARRLSGQRRSVFTANAADQRGVPMLMHCVPVLVFHRSWFTASQPSRLAGVKHTHL